MTKTTIIGITLISLIVLGIYWQGLSGPLLLDDGPQLLPIIKSISSNKNIQDYKEHVFSNSGILGRPVSMSTFILNAEFTGNSIWHWKLTNVILHLLCGLSIYCLTSLLLSFEEKINSHTVAFCITTIWLIHPLNVSTTLYLVQRMTILSTLFTTSALASYLYAVKKEINSKNGVPSLVISGCILFPLALFSKENAALLFLYVLLTTCYISRSTSISYLKFPKNIRLYNLIFLTLGIAGVILLMYFNDFLFIGGYQKRNFTLYERLFTESRVIVLYLAQILTPIPSIMGFFHDDITISKSISNPISTLFSLAAILITSFFCITKFTKLPLTAYGVIFFFISHILESTIFPLEIAFEHRNYFGMWGIILSVTTIILSTSDKLKINAGYIFLIACIILGSLTFNRTKLWGNQELLFPHMLSIHSGSGRLHAIFASSYAATGKYKEALSYLSTDSTFGAELQKLSIICQDTGKVNLDHLLNSKHIHPNILIGTDELEGITTLSNFGLDNKCSFSKTKFASLLSIISKSPSITRTNAQKIILYLAHYYRETGENDKSLIALRESFSKDDKNPIPLFLLTEWLIEINRIDEAKKIFTEAQNIANNSTYDYSEFISRILEIFLRIEMMSNS